MIQKFLNIKFEKAIRLLSENLPMSNETTRKPLLFHDIRVGVYLYERGYSEDIVLAGVLHDVIEFTQVGEGTLREEFGDRVTTLVLACTKDDSIEDKQEKTEDLILRCVAVGKEALIVKAADVLDSFNYYTSMKNMEQLEYCARNAEAIFRLMPEEWSDGVFEELKEWESKSFLVSGILNK